MDHNPSYSLKCSRLFTQRIFKVILGEVKFLTHMVRKYFGYQYVRVKICLVTGAACKEG